MKKSESVSYDQLTNLQEAIKSYDYVDQTNNNRSEICEAFPRLVALLFLHLHKLRDCSAHERS